MKQATTCDSCAKKKQVGQVLQHDAACVIRKVISQQGFPHLIVAINVGTGMNRVKRPLGQPPRSELQQSLQLHQEKQLELVEDLKLDHKVRNYRSSHG